MRAVCFLVFATLFTGNTRANEQQLRRRVAKKVVSENSSEDATVHCSICEEVSYRDADSDHNPVVYDYICETISDDEDDDLGDMTYYLQDIPDETMGIFKGHIHEKNGCIQVTFTHVVKHRTSDARTDFIKWTPKSQFDLLESQDERRLGKLGQMKIGSASVLVLSINGLDSENDDDLADKIFSTSSSSLKSVYEGCSFNQLHLEPAADGGNVIQNGVLAIDLEINVRGEDQKGLQNLATAAAEEMLGGVTLSNTYNHVMFCMPPGVLKNGKPWTAFAFVSSWKSVYSDCKSITAQVHEIGHNIGMGHSGEDGQEYGDATGFMGSGQGCFNAAKLYWLGWFSSRHHEVDPYVPTTVKLYPFADYETTTDDQTIVLKVGDYYMQYNRAKGINEGTKEKKDNVVVIKPTDKVQMKSMLVANVNKFNPVARIANYGGTGDDLVIERCSASSSSPEYIEVGIYLESFGASACAGGSPSPIYRLNNQRACYNKGTHDFLASPEECEAVCALTEGCNSFDYDHTRFNKRCRLCDKAQPQSDAACTSTEPCIVWGAPDPSKIFTTFPSGPTKMENVNGFWDLGKITGVASYEECEAACRDTTGCKSFTMQWFKGNFNCIMSEKTKPNVDKSGCGLPKCTEWGLLQDAVASSIEAGQ